MKYLHAKEVRFFDFFFATHLANLALGRPFSALPLEIRFGLEIARDFGGGFVGGGGGAGLDVEEPAGVVVVHRAPGLWLIWVIEGWFEVGLRSGGEGERCGF